MGRNKLAPTGFEITDWQRMVWFAANADEPYVISTRGIGEPCRFSEFYKDVDLGWAKVKVQLARDGGRIKNTTIKTRRQDGSMQNHYARIMLTDGTETTKRFWRSPHNGTPFTNEYYAAFAKAISMPSLGDLRVSLDGGDGSFFRKAEAAAEYRSTKAGRPFNLPPGWMGETYTEQRGRCAISGLPMFKDRCKRSPFQPVIDRIDPTDGYTTDNSRLISHIANIGRSDFDDETFVLVCGAVHRQHLRPKSEFTHGPPPAFCYNKSAG